MAHIREMVIESNKTLEESGSYRKAGRSMTVTFRPDEWPLSGPAEDGNWVPAMMALGKQLDHQVDVALGLTKEPSKQTKLDQEKESPEPEPKKDYKIRDPESPMTQAQHDGIEKLLKIPGAVKVVNTFRTVHEIDGGWDSLNKGQASDLMDILVQWSKDRKKEDKK